MKFFLTTDNKIIRSGGRVFDGKVYGERWVATKKVWTIRCRFHEVVEETTDPERAE